MYHFKHSSSENSSILKSCVSFDVISYTILRVKLIQSATFHILGSVQLTSVVLPLPNGHCNVCIFFVPREETREGNCTVRLHRTGQHIQL